MIRYRLLEHLFSGEEQKSGIVERVGSQFYPGAARVENIAKLIKERSAPILREEFPTLKRLPSLWIRSTFYSTAGKVSSEIIQNYTERQSKS